MRIGLLCVAGVAVNLSSCASPEQSAPETGGKPVVLVTIPPLAGIVREITGEAVEVHCLMGAGSTPHNFALKPSDMVKAEQADVLFMVHETLDGWATKLPVKNTVSLVDREGGEEDGDHGHTHAHGDFNPHFWSDPNEVMAVLPLIVDGLKEAVPEAEPKFKENAASFSSALVKLDEAVRKRTERIKGKQAYFFHPSWEKFLERYGIRVAAYVEPIPGKEMTPKLLRDLIDQAVKKDVSAIFTELQLPAKPAEHLGEVTGLPVYVLDPLGTPEERYEDLILRNLATLEEGLQ